MKLKDLKELSELNSPEYKGKMGKYQTDAGPRVMVYEQDKYSPYQNLLYKRALFGLSMYSEKELKTMHIGKKKRIEKVHARAQRSLNIFKQEKVNQLSNRIFTLLFPSSRLAKELIKCECIDPSFVNTMDLKTLGITKDDVIERFIRDGILPKDFYKREENEITGA